MSTQVQKLSSTEISFNSESSFNNWLVAQATTHQLTYLLAHAADGVIWGRFADGTLTTADQVGFKEVDLPPLRLDNLQECRLFGPQGEVLLWRGAKGWRSRHLSAAWEQPYLAAGDCITEKQLLWGTHGTTEKEFTLLRDGAQGLKHAVPISEIITFDSSANNKLAEPLRLIVRHYIKYDPEDGIAQIFLSRLVNFISQ